MSHLHLTRHCMLQCCLTSRTGRVAGAIGKAKRNGKNQSVVSLALVKHTIVSTAQSNRHSVHGLCGAHIAYAKHGWCEKSLASLPRIKFQLV